MSIDLVGGKAGRHITTLLVVPVEASPDAAEAALAAGCDPDGVGHAPVHARVGRAVGDARLWVPA